jgi:hypothetical protein
MKPSTINARIAGAVRAENQHIDFRNIVHFEAKIAGVTVDRTLTLAELQNRYGNRRPTVYHVPHPWKDRSVLTRHMPQLPVKLFRIEGDRKILVQVL